MKTWWLTLNHRERQLVLVASFVIVIGILYWGIWSPLSSRVTNMQTELAQQQDTLAWAKTQGERILSAGGAQSVAAVDELSDNPSQSINQSAARLGITISKMQPRGESIELWIDDVEFNQLMTWLNQLQQRYGLSTETLDLVAQEAAGHVKVRRLKLGSSD